MSVCFLKIYIPKDTSWDFPKTSELEMIVFVWKFEILIFPKQWIWHISIQSFDWLIRFFGNWLFKNFLQNWWPAQKCEYLECLGMVDECTECTNIRSEARLWPFRFELSLQDCFRHFDFSDMSLTFPIYLYIVSSENSIPTQIRSGTFFSANGRWTLLSAKKT